MSDPESKVSNAALTISAKGLSILRHHENIVPSYYNDPANNCSYGVGTLVHFGPCTVAEMHTKVTPEQVTASLKVLRRNYEAQPFKVSK